MMNMGLRDIYTVNIELKGLALPWATLFSPQKGRINHITDVSMYEARSERRTKQAEMWVLGCQPNSVPTKQLTPCHISLTAHISQMCAFVTENCSRIWKILRERCRTQLSALWMSKGPFACTLGQTHSSSPRLPTTNSTPLSHPQSCTLFPFCSQALMFTEPQVIIFAISHFEHLPWDPYMTGFLGLFSALSSLRPSWPLWLSLPTSSHCGSATPKLYFLCHAHHCKLSLWLSYWYNTPSLCQYHLLKSSVSTELCALSDVLSLHLWPPAVV